MNTRIIRKIRKRDASDRPYTGKACVRLHLHLAYRTPLRRIIRAERTAKLREIEAC